MQVLCVAYKEGVRKRVTWLGAGLLPECALQTPSAGDCAVGGPAHAGSAPAVPAEPVAENAAAIA